MSSLGKLLLGRVKRREEGGEKERFPPPSECLACLCWKQRLNVLDPCPTASGAQVVAAPRGQRDSTEAKKGEALGVSPKCGQTPLPQSSLVSRIKYPK